VERGGGDAVRARFREAVLMFCDEPSFDDLSDEELEEIDRKIAETPEGRELLRRIHLPLGKWQIVTESY
jgi:hypothetical protein